MMLILMVGHRIRALAEAERKLAKVHGRRAMLSVMNNKGGSTEEVARLSRRPELVAEILLDIASLVRGEDRECMQRLLIQAGVFDAICHAARRRPKVRRLCLEAISLFPIALAWRKVV